MNGVYFIRRHKGLSQWYGRFLRKAIHKKEAQMLKRSMVMVTCCLVSLVLFTVPALAGAPSIEKWKANFDHSGAKYKCIVSNVSHPGIKGAYVGFAIRDELWKRTNGQIYVDYKPFSMLGGEVEVLNQLQMGAIQGMGVSSVAAPNLGPRFGLLNLPFLINNFDKLDKFAESGKLFEHFMNAMDHQGIMGIDITAYGSYGWATTNPVDSLAGIRKEKLRIAEAAVNQLTYKSWGLNPIPMPWPDVPVALKQGVITALDHTPLVCQLTGKFATVKNYTHVEYAQGAFIWIFNKAWINKLPADLRETFIDVVHDVCQTLRKEGRGQEAVMISAAETKNGVTFHTLSPQTLDVLKRKGDAVHKEYMPQINKVYKGDAYKPDNYLKEVQEYMEYKP
jgi:TRAP-type C4-dicarboxylate transport system substrate-binding protein